MSGGLLLRTYRSIERSAAAQTFKLTSDDGLLVADHFGATVSIRNNLCLTPLEWVNFLRMHHGNDGV